MATTLRGRPRLAPAVGPHYNALFGHDWPGNVRELENIQREVIFPGGLAVTRTAIAIEPVTTAEERQ